MSDKSSVEYFAARALEEREMSITATDPSAAIAHAELADRYQALAKEFGSKTRSLKAIKQ